MTTAGHNALLEWLNEACKPQKVNDSLLVKLYGGHLIDKTILLKEIRHHRSQHQKSLVIMQEMAQQYKQLEGLERTKLAMPYLTLRRGILGEQAWQVWAQEVEAFLSAE
jgi:PadR family transcriptional regulator AphA